MRGYRSDVDDTGRPPLLLTAHAPDRTGRLAGAVVRHGEHPLDAGSRAAGHPLGPGTLPAVRTSVQESVPLLQLVYGAPPPAGDEPLPFDVDLPVAPTHPPQVQRCGAYAVLVDAGRVLLTRLAGGRRLWTLPGGGLDPGEHPADAVCREVREETGLALQRGRLLDVDSQHFTGHAPNGRLEDFHAVRFVYAGSVPTDVAPVVVEVDGSTDLGAWVPLGELDRLQVAPLVARALRLHGPA